MKLVVIVSQFTKILLSNVNNGKGIEGIQI